MTNTDSYQGKETEIGNGFISGKFSETIYNVLHYLGSFIPQLLFQLILNGSTGIFSHLLVLLDFGNLSKIE